MPYFIIGDCDFSLYTGLIKLLVPRGSQLKTEYITTESHMLVGLWKMHWYHGQQVWLLIDHDDSTLKILKSHFSTEHIKTTKVIS